MIRRLSFANFTDVLARVLAEQHVRVDGMLHNSKCRPFLGRHEIDYLEVMFGLDEALHLDFEKNPVRSHTTVKTLYYLYCDARRYALATMRGEASARALEALIAAKRGQMSAATPAAA